MSRRGDNIRKRCDGRWEARYPLSLREGGKRRYGSVYARSYTEVREKRDALLRQQSPKVRKTSTCVEDLLQAWQNANRIRLKPSSVSRYQNIMDAHIIPELGTLRVSGLTTDFLNKFIGAKLQKGRLDGSGGLSPAYVRSISMILEAAIKYGAAMQICEPLRTPITKPSAKRKEISLLEPDNRKRLEIALQTDMTDCKLLIFIALYSGLRIGEVLALCWEDIDLNTGVLYVRNSISRIWKSEGCKKHSVWVLSAPKTPTSRRVIPMCSKLIEIVHDYSGRKQHGFIYSKNGTFVSPRTFEYQYKRILLQCGIAPVNFHALRHTFATRCVESNVDIKSLSEVLGHADTSITLNTYVHASMELKRAQLEKIV